LSRRIHKHAVTFIAIMKVLTKPQGIPPIASIRP
jgi:hypothetical protein